MSSANPSDKSFYEQRSPLKAVMIVVEPTIEKVLEAVRVAAAEAERETLLNYESIKGRMIDPIQHAGLVLLPTISARC